MVSGCFISSFPCSGVRIFKLYGLFPLVSWASCLCILKGGWGGAGKDSCCVIGDVSIFC